MKKNVIAFGLTADRVFAVASVLMDISRYCSNYVDEVVIFHDNIKEKDQNLMKNIFSTKFIVYHFPKRIKSELSSFVLQRFTYMVFSKFESLKLLSRYKKVLWLDDDIVIKSDISELFDDDELGIRFVRLEGGKVIDQLFSPIDGYDMDAPASGAMPFIVQDNLQNYENLYKFCYKKVVEYALNLYLPEQAIFDIMIQEFNLKNCYANYFDAKIYCVHPNDTKLEDKAKILHAYGQPKFWNGLKNEQWEKNYKTWLEMGGSKYKKKSLLVKIKNKIQRTIKGKL